MNKLIDSFGREHSYLRISVTDRCNLRCSYCMPENGIIWKEPDEILSYEEITRLAKVFVEMGVNKIRITGGEPTVRNNIEELIKNLSSIRGLKNLAMTTNGIHIKEKGLKFKKAGLQSLNISLDTLDRERFIKITKRDYFEKVIEGINAAIEIGFYPLKLNVVVIANINEDEIINFVNLVKDKPINVRFIEFMPFEGNNWNYSGVVPYLKIRKIISEQYELIQIKTEKSAVAKDFCIEGFKGTVSFITSMTDSFCSTCNRIRLTANGNFKTCLFHEGNVSLRDLIRSGASDLELKEVIYNTLLLKNEKHEEPNKLTKIKNQSMIQIGG